MSQAKLKTSSSKRKVWQRLEGESEGGKVASFSLAVALHAGLFALMYFGFAMASIKDPERVGKPIEFMLIGVEQSSKPTAQPSPKPTPQRLPRPTPPKPEVTPPDTVTDHKPVVETPKPPDPFAIEQAEPTPEPVNEDVARRQSELDELIKQREEARKEADRKKRELEALQEQRALAAAIAAEEDQGLTGEVEDNSLLAQYRRAIEQTIEQRSHLSRDLRPGFLCWMRVTQLPTGEVMDVTPLAKCNATPQERAELIDGIMRASPLPYSGFEPVFDRLIDIPFQPINQ